MRIAPEARGQRTSGAVFFGVLRKIKKGLQADGKIWVLSCSQKRK